MIPRSARIAALTSAVALVALTLAAVPASVDAPAAADSPSCLEGYEDFPNLKGAPRFGTDTEVGVYVDGNLATGSGASEMEGTFVIDGDATFASGAYFNVGVVGAGSQVTPAAMTDMLITSGDVVVGAPANFVEVGNLIGGNIVAGGTVTGGGPSPTAFINTNGGSITEGAATPLAAYSTIPAYYQALSTTYDALADTGSVTNDAGNVYFDGNGTDTRQVFTVAGSVLGTIGSTKSMVFTNIPTDAVVIINVTGASATLSANSFSFSTTSVAGATVNPMAAEPDRVFSHFTQSLLWNFTTATTVTLGDQDQLLGSILVPTTGSALQLFTSTNGRIYVNGSLTLGGGTQSGLEIHNYPFREDCVVTPTTGSLSVTKALTDPDSVVAATRLFTGTVSCTAGTPSPNTWSIEAGQTATFTGIPSGSVCTITEDALTVPPSSTDSSYIWQPVSYTGNGVTIAASTTSSVTVTNEVRRALGNLELVKVLDDPFGVVALSRVYTGTFECSHLSATIESGTWSTTAGAPAITLATNLPAGTVCTVAEDALTVPPLTGFAQYQWRTPTVSPASITIVDGVTSRFTVTNTVFDPFALLASTGSDAALPLWIGGGLLSAGAIAMVLGYARRRRSA